LISNLLYTPTGINGLNWMGLKVRFDYQTMTIKVLGKRNKESIIPLWKRPKELVLEYILLRIIGTIGDEGIFFPYEKGNKSIKPVIE